MVAGGPTLEAPTGPLDAAGATEAAVDAGALTLEETTEPPGADNVDGGEAGCWLIALQATRDNPTEDPPTTRTHQRRPHARRHVTSPTRTSVTPTTRKTHHRAHRLSTLPPQSGDTESRPSRILDPERNHLPQ